MEWSTAVGLVGTSITMVTLVVALVMMVKRVHEYGEETLAAREGQLEQAAHKRRAEDARDAALVQTAAMRGERDAALQELRIARDAATLLIKQRQAELLGRVTDADEIDLVAISRDVFGGLPPVPAVPSPGGAAPATASGGDGVPAHVPAP